MCIIAVHEEGTDRISKRILKRCFKKNSHGIGMMWSEHGELRMWKSLNNFNGMWNRYTTLRDHGLPVAIHFRAASKGGISIENVHPFYLYKDRSMAYMHNGTFRDLGDLPDEVSDTRYFRDEILSQLPKDFLERQAWVEIVWKFTTGNRLVFMDKNGNYSIMHESLGNWADTAESSVWFSNTMWKPDRVERHNVYRGGSKYCHECDHLTDHYTKDCPDRDANVWPADGEWEREARKERGDEASADPTQEADQDGTQDNHTQDGGEELTEEEQRFLLPGSVRRPLDLDTTTKPKVRVVTDEGTYEELPIMDDPDVICQAGILYKGVVTCWSCIPFAEQYDPSMALSIPLPTIEELVCRRCGEVLYEPSAIRSGEGGYSL